MKKIVKVEQAMALLVLFVLLFSCGKKTEDAPKGAYSDGTIVLNEGVFMRNNADLSFISNNLDSAGLKIYSKVNKKGLGDVLQSYALPNETELYLVVNLSNKIEIVNRQTVKSIATIEGFNNPRFIAFADEKKAFVSNWGNPFSTPAKAPFLAVVDLTTKSITKKMYVGDGAEHVVKIQNRIYVGASFSNKIYVYDATTDALVDSLSTAPHSPYGMVVDENEKLWVMTYSFDASYNATKGAIVRFDVKTKKVEANLAIDATPNNIKSNLVLDKNTKNIYYMTGAGLYRLTTTANAIPSQAFIVGNYGSCGVNSKGQIYLGVTNYSDESKNAVKIFDASGKEIKSFATGFGPNAFVF